MCIRDRVETVACRVPVVATGTFGGPLAQQADFINRIHDTGVQAVIVITSQLVQPDESDEVFMEQLHKLLALTEGTPLGLYECPVPYKRLINSTMLAELLPTGRIVYHKDTSLDADEVARRLKVAAVSYTHLDVYKRQPWYLSRYLLLPLSSQILRLLHLNISVQRIRLTVDSGLSGDKPK